MGAFGESEIIPDVLEVWRTLIVRFNLNNIAPFQDWVILIHYFEIHLISSPRDLTHLAFPALKDLPGGDVNFEMITKLRQAFHIGLNPKRGTMGTSINFATNAGLLAQSIRHKDINNTLIAKQFDDTADSLELPDNFNTLGPASEIKFLAQSELTEGPITQLLNTVVSLNVIRQCKDSLPSVAAGVQRYSAFCDLMKYPYSHRPSLMLSNGDRYLTRERPSACTAIIY